MSQCSLCTKTFTLNKNLYQHMRKKHNISPQVPGKISCPLQCDEKFRTHKELRNHLKSSHSVEVEKEELDFPDFESFELWRKEFQETSGYAYVRRISEKTLRKGEAKTHFICHRSGVHRSESTGRRKMKKVGSNKIGTTCPSTMEMSRSLVDGKVKVVFWKTHLGHEADVQRSLLHKRIQLRSCDSIKYSVCAVLPAAGIGERMGLGTPKQYIPVHQKPIICYTVEAFLRISYIKKVVVVAATENLELMLQTLSQMCTLKDEKLMVTEGRGSRHQSIESGLRALKNCCDFNPEVVVIHDGVRPFVADDIITSVVKAAKEHGAAGVMCPLVSTVISVNDNGFLDHALDRNKLKASEMPQAFQYNVICRAYEQCSDYDREYGTECLHLAQKYMNVKPKLVSGDSNSWKVTHKKDIYAAAGVIKENQDVGIINGVVCPEFVPFMKNSLSKSFKMVHELKRLKEFTALSSYPNLIRIYRDKNPFYVMEQLTIFSEGFKISQFISMVNILFSGIDSSVNFLQLQKQGKDIARTLKTKNMLIYFIVLEEYGTEETFETVADTAASLLFDSNPNLSGNIIVL